MGFGQLFIGYFFLIFFPLSRIDVLPNLAVVGCIFMFLGLRKLTFYCPTNKPFALAKIALAALSALCIMGLMLDVASLDTHFSDATDAILIPVTNSVYAIGIVGFTACLFVGIYKLSIEVELPKLAKKSTFMLSVSVAYLLLEICSTVCSVVHSVGDIEKIDVDVFIHFTSVTVYSGLFAFLAAYLTLFLNLSVLFSAYARICLEGDEDMPSKEDSIDKIIEWKNKHKK